MEQSFIRLRKLQTEKLQMAPLKHLLYPAYSWSLFKLEFFSVVRIKAKCSSMGVICLVNCLCSIPAQHLAQCAVQLLKHHVAHHFGSTACQQ